MNQDEREKKWILSERLAPDLLDHLLAMRGIENRTDFFEPSYPNGLHDPYLMKGMKPAIDRITKAINNQETIGIFADYDTDGTPGAALFIDGLRQLNIKTKVYISTRTEGYGLSEKGLQALADEGAGAVVTIDLGITGGPLMPIVKKLGLDLIVTDHHIIQPELFPKGALTVINPKQADCQYPFKELCGGGIIWKVWGALVDRLIADQSPLTKEKNPEALKRWALDLAAISTICDMVPLIDENRLIAYYGLKVLQKTRRPGLMALFEIAGIKKDMVSTSTVGFQIGPRINAPTRMEASTYQGEDELAPQASIALALLLSTNREQGILLAKELHEHNTARQNLLERVYREAVGRVEHENLASKKIIFVTGADWPSGIVGLVAGRLMERYGRPAIVMGHDGVEAVGSARSVDGFHLVEALNTCQKWINKYGGHAKAAALSMELKHVETVYQELLAYAEGILSDDQVGPRIKLDAEITADEISFRWAELIHQMEPYGIGNPKPLFLLSDVMIVEKRKVGSEGQHLKLRFRFNLSDSNNFNAVAFRQADRFENFPIDTRVDLAAYLQVNEWQGNRSVELNVIDVRLAEDRES